MVFREILRLGKPCKCRLAVEGEQILQKHVGFMSQRNSQADEKTYYLLQNEPD